MDLFNFDTEENLDVDEDAIFDMDCSEFEFGDDNDLDELDYGFDMDGDKKRYVNPGRKKVAERYGGKAGSKASPAKTRRKTVKARKTYTDIVPF